MNLNAMFCILSGVHSLCSLGREMGTTNRLRPDVDLIIIREHVMALTEASSQVHRRSPFFSVAPQSVKQDQTRQTAPELKR